MINEKLCDLIASLRHGLNYRVLAQDAEKTRENALLSHVFRMSLLVDWPAWKD
jgi:hypothetical protein